MLKPEAQQALFDKYAPDPTGAPWDINRFANRIATEPSPRGDWLRKYLHVVCDDTIKTKFNDPDMTESIVANPSWLFCGEPHTKLPTLLQGVAWHDVTDEMVDNFLATMENEFATFDMNKAITTLASVNYDDTREERGDKLKDVVSMLMPEKIEGYIDMSHDVPEKDMLMHIKYNLIEYIANL